MHCPWENWRLGELGFCEAQLCSWIKQPGNTYSNVGFIVVGIWLLFRIKRDKAPLLNLLAISSIGTGLGSAFFHASGSSLGQSMDYFGMFLQSGAMTALNTRRLKELSYRGTYVVFTFTTLILWLSILLFPNLARWIFSLGSPCYLIELRLYALYRHQTQYRYLLYSSLVMAVAMLFWGLDLSGTLCNPDNHFLSGHSLWHLLTALSLGLLYFYYLQFPALKSTLK